MVVIRSVVLVSVVLAVAAIFIGAATRGWTRIAALISSVTILFVMVFWVTHCDL